MEKNLFLNLVSAIDIARPPALVLDKGWLQLDSQPDEAGEDRCLNLSKNKFSQNFHEIFLTTF